MIEKHNLKEKVYHGKSDPQHLVSHPTRLLLRSDFSVAKLLCNVGHVEEEDDADDVDGQGEGHGEVGQTHGNIVMLVRDLACEAETRPRRQTLCGVGYIANPGALKHLVTIVVGVGVGIVVVYGQLVVRHKVEDEEEVGDAQLDETDKDGLTPFLKTDNWIELAECSRDPE